MGGAQKIRLSRFRAARRGGGREMGGAKEDGEALGVC